MIKKQMILCVAIMAAMGVRAETETVNGITWTYTVSEGKASVGGGSDSSTAILTTKRGIIIIPAKLGGYPVTSIASSAFWNCSEITSVRIPDGVVSIGKRAFYNCSSLESVMIPDSITDIKNQAFSGCTSLKELHISNLAKWCEISFDDSSANPLASCSSVGLYLNGDLIVDLKIPDGVTRIKDYVFYSGELFETVLIPSSVEFVGNYAFNFCNSIKSLNILNGVTNIGNHAFYNCKSLTSVKIPNHYHPIEG